MIRPPYDAIVPAGGGAVRLGGIDKPGVDIGGRRIVDRVIDALADAAQVVVVGGGVASSRDNVITCGDVQPDCGPAGAVVSGLLHVTAVLVVLVAGDMPFVTAELVEQLVSGVTDDGVVAIGADGRPQWLLSAWRTDALRAAGLRPSGSMHVALQPLRWQSLHVDALQLLDCDTPDDVRRARELAR